MNCFFFTPPQPLTFHTRDLRKNRNTERKWMHSRNVLYDPGFTFCHQGFFSRLPKTNRPKFNFSRDSEWFHIVPKWRSLIDWLKTFCEIKFANRLSSLYFSTDFESYARQNKTPGEVIKDTLVRVPISRFHSSIPEPSWWSIMQSETNWKKK